MKSLTMLALFPTLILSNASAAAFERKAWQDDYAFLKTALEQRYANLAWFAAPQGGPNCTRLRADGSNEVAGVKPDLPVLPTEGENDRARAWRLLDTLASDVRRR